MKTIILLLLWGLIFLIEPKAVYSQDALDHWYLRDTNKLTKVRFVGGMFIGVGKGGTLLTSVDGGTWISRTSGTTASLTGVAGGIALGQYLFVVVGEGPTVLTSTDATNWIPVAGISASHLTDVAYANSRFVATTTRSSFTQPNLISSANGFNWSSIRFIRPTGGYGDAPDGSQGPYIASAIASLGSNGPFVTAGGVEFGYAIWQSANGTTWKNVGFANQYVANITYGNGKFIMVGYEGFPTVSTDALGTNWFGAPDTNIDMPTPAGNYPMTGNDIAFGNGTFFLARGFLSVFYLVPPNTYPQLTSTNALNWTRRQPLSNVQLDTVAFGNGTFVAAGPSGIYQSEPVRTPVITARRRPTTNALELLISGELGRVYKLQTSTNMLTWSDALTFTNTGPMTNFVDPINPAMPGRYYRVLGP